MALDTTTDLSLCDQKGSEMSLYYDTADGAGTSSCATPVWVFMKSVTGDMNINDTVDEEEQSSRDPDMEYKQYAESKPDLEITGELQVDRLYEGNSYINACRPGGLARNFLALTSYITNVGSVGFKGKMRNFDFSISGPESGPPRQQFKLRPAACIVSACKITHVAVEVANAIVTYDPRTFVAASAMGMVNPMAAEKTLAEQIAEHDIYKALKWSKAEEVFTDVGPLLLFLGEEKVDGLLTALMETNPIPSEKSSRSARRRPARPMGIGGFDRAALLKVLDEIVLNG